MIGNKNSYEGKNVYFVRTVTKDKETKEDVKPYFSFVQKVGEKYEEKATATSFKGDLVKVSTGEREFKGAKQPETKITLEDGKDVYILSLNYTILSRSVFNSLLSLDNQEGIQFSIYQTKPKDNKVFPQISLWQNDTMIKWEYALDELPEIKKVKIKGALVSDTEEIDQFFVAKLKEKFESGVAKTQKVDAPAEDSNGSNLEVPF